MSSFHQLTAFVALVFSFVFHHHHVVNSVTEYVYQTDCSSNSTDCVIECDSCSSGTFHCPTTSDCDSCIFLCEGTSSCQSATFYGHSCKDVKAIAVGGTSVSDNFRSATFYAPDNFGNLTLIANTTNKVFRDGSIYSATNGGYSGFIKLPAVNTLDGLLAEEYKSMFINATSAQNLEIQCTTRCRDSTIYCPYNEYTVNGEWGSPCLVNCTGSDDRTCRSMYVYADGGTPRDVTMICDTSLVTTGDSLYCAGSIVYCTASSYGDWSQTCDWMYSSGASSPWSCDGACYQTFSPTLFPSINPSIEPSMQPSVEPSNKPSNNPSTIPTNKPTKVPNNDPTITPTHIPTMVPTISIETTILTTTSNEMETTMITTRTATATTSARTSSTSTEDKTGGNGEGSNTNSNSAGVTLSESTITLIIVCVAIGVTICCIVVIAGFVYIQKQKHQIVQLQQTTSVDSNGKNANLIETKLSPSGSTLDNKKYDWDLNDENDDNYNADTAVAIAMATSNNNNNVTTSDARPLNSASPKHNNIAQNITTNNIDLNVDNERGHASSVNLPREGDNEGLNEGNGENVAGSTNYQASVAAPSDNSSKIAYVMATPGGDSLPQNSNDHSTVDNDNDEELDKELESMYDNNRKNRITHGDTPKTPKTPKGTAGI